MSFALLRLIDGWTIPRANGALARRYLMVRNDCRPWHRPNIPEKFQKLVIPVVGQPVGGDMRWLSIGYRINRKPWDQLLSEYWRMPWSSLSTTRNIWSRDVM